MPPKPPQRIPAADVDFLISALHRIKFNGGLHGYLEDMENWFDDANDWIDPNYLPFPDELTCKFCEPDISPPTGCHRYPKDAHSLRDALRQLKAVDVVVKLIRKSLSQRVMCLGKRCAELELKNGLRGTPDEVLSDIFQLAHLSSGRQGHRVTTTLASVCTRFRNICLQSPGMWSSLSSDQSAEMIRLNLARSKESQLSVFLTQRLRAFPDRKMVEFLHIVTPHSRRWAYLDITTHDHTHFAKTFSKYTALDLPKLLHIRCMDPNAGHQMIHGPFIYFCSMWNIPSLQRFDGYNVVPDQNSVGSHIRECYLKWNAWEPGAQKSTTENTVELPIEYLSGCLRTLASLQHLTLDFEEARINSGTLPRRSSADQSLANLASFTLIIGIHISPEPLGKLLESLLIRNLDIFDVTLMGQEVSDQFVTTFFCKGTSDLFRPLKTFTLITDITMPIAESSLILQSLLTHSPSLRNLWFHAPSIEFIDPETFSDFRYSPACFRLNKSLQNLRFENCDMLTEEDLKDIYDAFLPVGEHLIRVEIFNCKLLKEHFLAWYGDKTDLSDVELIWET